FDPSAVKSAAYTVRVATPTFSPDAGLYSDAQNVVVTCGTTGAEMHYTTNGIDPTESDPVVASGSAVLVDRTLTLKARAWKASFDPSAVKSAAYTVRVATPTFSPDAGWYPEAQNVAVSSATAGAAIHYTCNGDDPDESDSEIESGSSVLVEPPTTLKARAFKSGFDPSPIKSAFYGLAHIIRVKPSGSDSNDGSTWNLAKQTILAGLNAADFGDEVWVAGDSAHPYYERITLKAGVGLYGGFAGAETHRSQRDWNANVTVLDGRLGGSVVTSPANAPAETRIDGFTITLGQSALGGGIFSGERSYLVVANNVITDNYAQGRSPVYNSGYGGGVYGGANGHLTIIGNTIAYNDATGWTDDLFSIWGYGGVGGGIYCGTCTLIADNTISDNQAYGSDTFFDPGQGGGVWCGGGTITRNTVARNSVWGQNSSGGGIYGGTLVQNNLIEDNSSDEDGAGIATDGIVMNNTIRGNIAAYYGGGVSCGSLAIIADNTIQANSAYEGSGVYCEDGRPLVCNNTIISGSGYGSALCTDVSSTPTVANNVVAFNVAGLYLQTYSTPQPVVSHNCVYGN
ncbi:MAG: chitobiase/beta-hexosaminidase C-terminal domain-containing protein, partial [Armatimonadetes bacterium]|nr:chitobiase/beta-hexosaminidase C-terminal domain-containing protein [Armatimonadota bacterium]